MRERLAGYVRHSVEKIAEKRPASKEEKETSGADTFQFQKKKKKKGVTPTELDGLSEFCAWPHCPLATLMM